MLLIGGADKDLPWDSAIHFALRKARHIVLFGEDGAKQVASKVMKLMENMRCARTTSSLASGRLNCSRGPRCRSRGSRVISCCFRPAAPAMTPTKIIAARGLHFRQLVSEL